MENHSPFLELIVNKDVYALLHMIKFLPPNDLRNLSASSKRIFHILGQDVRFIWRAYISALRGYTITRSPPQRIPNFGSHMDMILRRFAEFLILNKENQPQERFDFARNIMYHMNNAVTASKLRTKHYFVGDTVNTAISNKLRTVLETLVRIADRLEILQNEDSPHLRYRNKLTHIREMIEILDQVATCQLRDYLHSYSSIDKAIRKNFHPRYIKKEKRHIKKVVANPLAMIDYLLPAIITEVTQLARRRESEIINERDKIEQSVSPNRLNKLLMENPKIRSKLLTCLGNKDIRALRSTSKETEWAIICSGIGIHKALYKPLAKNVSKEMKGSIYKNILAWLSKGAPTNRDRYMCLRRLINARLEEDVKSKEIELRGEPPNLIKIRIDFDRDRREAINAPKVGESSTTWKGRSSQMKKLSKYIFEVWRQSVGYEDKEWLAKIKSRTREKIVWYATREAAHVTLFTLQLSAEMKYKSWDAK